MAYGLNASCSLETCIERALCVEAALRARPSLKDLAPEWLERAVRFKGLREARDEARHRVSRANAVLAVVGVDWDEEIDALFNEVRFLPGDEAQTTRGALFGEVRASEAMRFGAERALAFGETLSFRLTSFDHPRLVPHREPLAAANQAMREGLTERDAAEAALWQHNLARTQAVAELADALKTLEAKVLTLAPGHRALVRAVLSMPEVKRHPRPTPEA